MSKRNLVWLVAVVGVGAIVWITVGFVWGLIAAVATLVASELFERERRKRRRLARGETARPKLSDAVKARRRR